MTLIPFDDSTFYWGQAGLPGANAPAGQIADLEDRVSDLEGLTPPTVISDLSDVDTAGAVTGDLLRYNSVSGNWEDYTWPGITYTFGIPFVIDGGGSAITSGTKYQGVEVPFACTVTGWTITGNVSGSIVCTVSRATYANHNTYTAISGTEKPTLAAATKNQDLTLSTWTTSLAAGDLLQVAVDSLATSVTLATVSLRLTRTI